MSRVRAVLDNNILVSGLISTQGSPAGLIAAWRNGKFQLVTSVEQFKRLADVLGRPKFAKSFNVDDRATLLRDILHRAAFAIPRQDVTASRDSEDNLILGTAVAGQAEYVVTGDKRDLLHLKEFEGVKIITAREALEILRQIEEAFGG